jgi:hypothetical protein
MIRVSPNLALVLISIILSLFKVNSQVYAGEAVLVNPSFEEDFENDSVPDGWNIPRDVNVKLVSNCSHGNKAAEFSSGYIMVQQDVHIENLKNQKIKISFDAVGTDGACLGVLLGYVHKLPDGTMKWENHRLLWDSVLSEKYQTINLEYQCSSDAEGPRVWLGIYRSNKQGVVLLDNCRLFVGEISPAKKAELTRLSREWRYLEERAKIAKTVLGEIPQLSEVISKAQSIQSRCASDDDSLLGQNKDIEQQLAKLSVEICSLLCPGEDIVVSFSDPYVRLLPTDLPAKKTSQNYEVATLCGEYQAIGLDVTNCTTESKKINISLEGIDQKEFRCEIRKQVFLETWYQREKERIADPLPLLPYGNSSWQIEILAGKTEKLYIGMYVPDKFAGVTVSSLIKIEESKGVCMKLPLALKVLSASVPKHGKFDFMMFMYPEMNVSSHSPELTARDLAEHGVTGIEFPYIPKVTFTPNGEIATVDFSRHDNWMKSYGHHINKLMLFWEGTYDSFDCTDGSKLQPFSDNWKRAYRNLLRSWLNHAKKAGFDVDKFSVLPDDEASSRSYKIAPDEAMLKTVEILKITREVAPDLEIVSTLSDYALVPDIKAMLPYIDVILPLWPYRDVTLRNQPDGYNPRSVYYETIYPILDAQRKKNGLKIHSYHISRGKTEDVLISNRAYPVIVVGEGLTGAGSWAYNVSMGGTTWVDTDGGLLDYILVYDGKENNPINHKVNPTGEVIVPSIRWEALCAGIQDAQILLYLKEVKGKSDISIQKEIQSFLDEAAGMGHDVAKTKGVEMENYSGIVTPSYISDYARRLRILYEKVLNTKPSI